MTALAALIASAVAGAVAPSADAAVKKRAPVITGVSPMNVAVAQVLTIRGRNFVPGRFKNTVVFKRVGARAVFVKAEIATKKMLRVTVPRRITDTLAVRDGAPIPTKFALRVLARKFGKRFTGDKLSPMVGPELPPVPDKPVVDPDGDCDSDGLINKVDLDDDNDLLSDATEIGLRYPLDPCKVDTDGDGIGDGYELRSARDLNNDEYQNPNAFMPYPGKKPYPNPLDGKDTGVDFDGDGLTLADEHALWKYTLAAGSPAPTVESLQAPAAALTYSDGFKYSVYNQPSGDDRRSPALAAAGYAKEADFHQWMQASGYWVIHRWYDGSTGPLLDFNRDNSVSETVLPGFLASEAHYLDRNGNGWLSDDERDEDADGLSNWDEAHGRMTPEWWMGRYKKETPFRITYAGTSIDDADSDGDGIRDGADDQDHDDIPNVVELSRIANTGRPFDDPEANPATVSGDPVRGRVQPFNPCEPFIDSRTCPTYIPFDSPWAPFDGPPWKMDGNDPNYLVLN